MNLNALKRFIIRCGSAKRDTGMLLLAAGETLDGPIVHCADSTGNRTQVPLSDYLKPVPLPEFLPARKFNWI